MVFVLPPKSAVGVLSAEIAGEGEKIIMSNGEQVNWTPPPARPVVPDFSGIKSIARYFGRSGYTPWPAWLYHDKEEPRLVKNADEAAELGVCYRETTEDERNRYGKTAMWDWTDESKWRPNPWAGTQKFDAKKNHQGKNVIIGEADPRIGQNELVRALVRLFAFDFAAVLFLQGFAAALVLGTFFFFLLVALHVVVFLDLAAMSFVFFLVTLHFRSPKL